MSKRILFCFVIILASVFVGVPISSSAEIKTLEDFRNSAFLKKYPQKRQMSSWPLREGGYNYSFSFPIGNPPLYDEYDSFSVSLVVESKDSPIIYHFGIMFHDESAPSGPTTFTKHVREIFQDFIRSIDLTLPLKDVVDYVQKKSVFKYRWILDAPKETFAKYSFRVGVVGHDLIISIDTPTAPPQKPTPTIDQRLSEAKKALDTEYQPNKDPMKTKWGHVVEAEEHLKAIKHYDNEQQKADAGKLMREIERRKREIEKVAKVVAKKIMIQQREDIGKKMDKVFLDQGMDVEVILEGNEKDILTLKYVLWSRPLVHKFTNGGDMSDGGFLSNLKKTGFKRVNFNNKYDYSVYYNLTKVRSGYMGDTLFQGHG